MPCECLTSAENIWNAHWCGPLSPTNHDQLSFIYLFKHCRLFVTAEVIYRVCHFLWLFIICLILFYKKKGIAARNCGMPDASIYPLCFGVAKTLGNISCNHPPMYTTSFSLSPVVILLSLISFSILFHFIYISLPFLFFIHASLMSLSQAHKWIS